MAEPFDGVLAELRLRLPQAQTILLLYGDSEPMEVQCAHGVDIGTVFTTAPVSLSVVAKVRTSGEPILSAGTHEELTDSSSLLLAGIRAVVCVPVRDLKRKVRGIIYADQRMQSAPFDRTDLFRMIQSARDLERSLEKLEWKVQPRSKPARPVRPRPLPLPPQVLAPRERSDLTLPLRSQVIFTRSLSTMLGSGISIARALTVIEKHVDDAGLSEASMQILLGIERGLPLAESMRRCGPRCFSEFSLGLVKVGETSGSLVKVLRDLADYDERTHNLVMGLRSKLTYPLLVFAACLIMLIILPPLAIRGPLKAITDLGQTSPWLTQVVVGTATAIGSPLGMGLILLTVALGLGSLRRLRSHPQGRLWLHSQLLRWGPLGRGLRLLAATRFAVSMGIMMRSGVSLLVAVPAAVASCDDPALASQLPKMMHAIGQGQALSQVLQEGRYFPSSFTAVLVAGEQTGSLDRTLPWIAGMYELELESQVEMVCAALEPTMMLMMGVTAALIALAVMLPLVRLVSAL